MLCRGYNLPTTTAKLVGSQIDQQNEEHSVGVFDAGVFLECCCTVCRHWNFHNLKQFVGWNVSSGAEHVLLRALGERANTSTRFKRSYIVVPFTFLPFNIYNERLFTSHRSIIIAAHIVWNWIIKRLMNICIGSLARCSTLCVVFGMVRILHPSPVVHYYSEVNLYPCQEAQCHVYLIKELFINSTKKGEERFTMKWYRFYQ